MGSNPTPGAKRKTRLSIDPSRGGPIEYFDAVKWVYLKEIGEIMGYRGDLEIGPDGSTQIFVQPLLGCYSRAATRSQALRKIPSKIRMFNDWLAVNGEEVDEKSGRIRFRACEVVNGDWPVDLGDSVALFQCDRAVLTSEEITKYIRWMHYSWNDFRDLVRKVPRRALHWKPSPETRRSIRDIIVHMMLVQIWYLWKLQKVDAARYRYPRGMSYRPLVKNIESGDISLPTLDSLRHVLVSRLNHMEDRELTQVTYHKPGNWTGRSALEGWTARKVFRRFLWHEKLHMNTMKKLLWSYRSRP